MTSYGRKPIKAVLTYDELGCKWVPLFPSIYATSVSVPEIRDGTSSAAVYLYFIGGGHGWRRATLAQNVRASSLTNIDVNTTNGVVTLAGSETVAASVPGVVRVNNELQVASAASVAR